MYKFKSKCGHIINQTVKNELLETHSKKQAILLAFISKFKANQENANYIGVKSVSQVVNNPPQIFSFDVFSHNIKIVNDINKLQKAIDVLSIDLNNQRNLYMMISFGRNGLLHALPKQVKDVCKNKYPDVYFSF